MDDDEGRRGLRRPSCVDKLFTRFLLLPRCFPPTLPPIPMSADAAAGPAPKGNQREETLKLLSDYSSHFASYHNHKETSAWAGVALGVVTIGQLLMVSMRATAPGIAVKAALCGAIVMVGALTYAFFNTQLTLRRRAAALLAACLSMRLQMLEDERAGGAPLTLSAPRREIRARHMQTSYFLPEQLTQKADEFEAKGTGIGNKLDQYTRVTVVTVSAAAVLVIVLSN